MSVTAVARRYAEALADAAIAGNQLDRCDAELGAFAQMMKTSRELREVFASPIVSLSDKGRVLEAILGRTNPGQLTANLLRLLLRHYRLHHLEAVYERFRREVNERKGIAVAEVSTAVPVGPPDQEKLRGRLQQIVGKQVQLQFKTDSALIGGVVTRIGSVVYDGSIHTQLQEIKQRLKEGETA